MRERLTLWIAVLIVAVLVCLALAFALLQNPPSEAMAPGKASPPESFEDGPAQELVRGRAVYEEQGCAKCHAIGGAGNPRYPLDGVGGRSEAEEIRAWIIAREELRDSLPPGAFRRKQRYREMPAEDLDALVGYLVSLKDER